MKVKRFLAALLALCMVICLLPVMALADNESIVSGVTKKSETAIASSVSASISEKKVTVTYAYGAVAPTDFAAYIEVAAKTNYEITGINYASGTITYTNKTHAESPVTGQTETGWTFVFKAETAPFTAEASNTKALALTAKAASKTYAASDFKLSATALSTAALASITLTDGDANDYIKVDGLVISIDATKIASIVYGDAGKKEITVTGFDASNNNLGTAKITVSVTQPTASITAASINTQQTSTITKDALERACDAATDNSLKETDPIVFKSATAGSAVVNSNGSCTYTPGTAAGTADVVFELTDTAGYKVLCTVKVPVTVKSSAASIFNYTPSLTVRQYVTVPSGKTIKSVVFDATGLTSFNGTLYSAYGNTPSSRVAITGKATSILAANLANVTFVPYAGFIGSVTIPYTVTCTDDTECSGSLVITVGAAAASAITATPVYANEGAVVLTAKYTAAKPVGSYFSTSNISYVVFTGAVGATVKYAGVSMLMDAKTYYPSTDGVAAQNLSGVVFEPTSVYKASGSTATVSYVAYTTSGYAYTGTINITFPKYDFSYNLSTEGNALSDTEFENFIDSCGYAIDGHNSTYKFFKARLASLPSFATVYYNGTKLTNLYTDITDMSKLRIVPNAGVTGTYYLEFNVYYAASNGTTALGSYDTTVAFIVSAGAGNIVYQTVVGGRVYFSGTDFGEFYSSAASGYTLSYITLGSLPAASEGVLYSKYLGNTSASTIKADTATKYYLTSTSATYAIGDLTFLAASNYNYTVTIPFTGYNSTGVKLVNGTITIRVNKGTVTAVSDIAYSAGTTIDGLDIYSNCTGITGGKLSYINIELPAATEGKLYYNYTDCSNYTSLASAKTDYYYGATVAQSAINKLTFVPIAGFNGTVKLKFTAYDESGNWYVGEYDIVVSSRVNTGSAVFTDVTKTSYNWAADAVDFLYSNNVTTGATAKTFKPAASITRADFAVMLYRAFGLDSYLTAAARTANFTDVASNKALYTEAQNAILVLKYLGISNGDGTGNYAPFSPITRQEAMKLIYGTLTKLGHTLDYTVKTTASSFKDYSSVATWASTAISYLVTHGVVLGTDGKINPASNISRAEMAVILHRVITY